MSGEPTFFEIGVADPERGRAFYGSLLGWTFEPGTSEGGGFAVTTGGVPGGMHGGDAGASPYLFFRVDDLDAAVARVRELGGTVEDPGDGGDSEESAARFGRFKLCRDDQGSAFGLHEPPK
ncbi:MULTISPECIES: VOC family protein [unclassified Streptomyces]|uniref:VOC family protein n=1 Tax=unclassified Streptomyces TaxID=2593676 RepID=UPI0033FA9C61